MPGRKPWHDSPYDEHGMPLGVETVDYDNAEEVKKHMVQDKYVPEIPLNDPEYQPKQMSKTFTGQRPLAKKNFNTAVTEQPEIPNVVDIEDPAERRELIVSEAEDKGFREVPELPKVASDDDIKAVKEDREEVRDAEEKPEDEKPEPDFLAILNATDKKDEDNDGVQK